MEISHLKYNKINFEKYNYCIENAYNSRVYAYSWYLDIVTNNDWEVLVLGDYKAVMPLPFKRIKRKLLKRMITQPLFCQQLGVFSLEEIGTIEFQNFLEILYALKPNLYHFNAINFKKNTIEQNNFKKRNNFELKLNNPFEEIQKGYSKGLKGNIKKAFKNKLIMTNDVTVKDFILMYDKNKKYKIKMYKLIEKLLNTIQVNNLGKFYGIKKDTNLIAIVFFIETNNRFVYLFSVSSLLGKQLGAISFLFDTIIKKNASSNIIIDFEGSMIPGVAKFFKSFGTKNVPYFVFDKN